MMNEKVLFPSYVTRKSAEVEFRQVATRVQSEQASRVLMLYGPGGVGKSHLVRHLAEKPAVEGVIWLEPIDVDDSEFWLMANLERKIADRLNSDGGYFQEYLDRVSELPRYERLRVGHETVLAHLRRAGEVFHRCYEQYVTQKQQALVITLDTIEAIRGTDMVLGLTQWMKRLPATLFILSGRPRYEGQSDPILEQFMPEHPQPMPYGIIKLAGFTFNEALTYLADGRLTHALTDDEKEKIVLLTQGHPLWLALAVDYLDKARMPEATVVSLDRLREIMPYQQPLPAEGQRLHEDFVRSLIIPYRESDFQHEAIKRLAVARRRMNREMWETLMADRRKEISDMNAAWNDLLRLPWIRLRANRQFITLHDALAEELGRRIIPLQGENWYRQQWQTMTRIHIDLLTSQQPEIEQEQSSLEGTLQEVYTSEEKQRGLIDRVRQLDARIRNLDDLKAAYLYYQLLCDFEVGCRQFVNQFDEATHKHEFRLRELLWMEMQRFLPGETAFEPLSDIVHPTIELFKKWLTDRPEIQYEIGQRGAAYLVDSGRAMEADERLTRLLKQFGGDLEKEYRLFNLRGNARMKIAGRVQEAEADFQEALRRTQDATAPAALQRLQGQAYKEIGFYYRNIGKMTDAAQSYLDALCLTPLGEQQERASIQTNWAYVQALRGRYEDALNLVDTALLARRRLNLRREMGMTLSVKGEALRYARNFAPAWEAYQESSAIFEIAGDWPWLGTVYQEQAICLFQAASIAQKVGSYESTEDMRQRARELSAQALAICHDMSIRGYPSALNRVARILGEEQHELALAYLTEGIKAAEETGDGWFLYANIVEYAELCYRVWSNTHDASFRERIQELQSKVEEVQKDYQFLDLSGRWNLLQGHLAIHDFLATSDEQQGTLFLVRALEHYKRGFAQEVRSFWGSHGAAAIPFEFERFGNLFAQLPLLVRENWCQELEKAWTDPQEGYIENLKQATSLLAQLTKLYAEYVLGQPQEGVTS